MPATRDATQPIPPPAAPVGAPADDRRVDGLTVGCAVVAVLLLALMAVQLVRSDQAARRSVEERQAARVTLASHFLDAYIADVLERTEATAGEVAGPTPTQEDLATVVREMNFRTALLLDPDGVAIAALPASPGLIGRRIGEELPNLRIARGGRANVSNVVVSVSTGEPIVAFAVPFETPYGTRVLSGGFAVTDTPLGPFLRSFSSIPGNAIYLVDDDGKIVAASDPSLTGTLAGRDPYLAESLAMTRTGPYRAADGDRFYASESVTSAPWRLVASVPADGLYQSVNRDSLPWLLFGAFAVAAVLVVLLVSRVTRQRRQLAATVERDALTGLYNRRHLDRQLKEHLARARRTGHGLGVLLIDVDHFKAINDRHGHERGDEVLVALGNALYANVRPTDTVARWGGEEFMVLAPDTSPDDAARLAERLRAGVSAAVAVDGEPVTVSIGYTTLVDQRLDSPTSRADIALYRAKAEGRNRTRTLDGELVAQPA